MRPWNSAYRKNVKYLYDFLQENHYKFNLERYSNERIGCTFSVWLIENNKPHSIEIYCGAGVYVEDRKARPYYFIVHNNNHYEITYLKQIYDFFNRYKECGIRSACEFVQKNTDTIKEQFKITKDFE